LVERRRHGSVALAIVLFAGFHLAPLLVAAALFAVPLHDLLGRGGHVGLISAAFALTALAVLHAVLPPRREERRLETPLSPAGHPRLFELIETVAAGAGRAAPDAVALTLGSGSHALESRGRRVLVLGRCDLEALDCSELRALVAHELARLDAGGTAVGRWAVRTRRRLDGPQPRWILSRSAALFVRLTRDFARAAELQADADAARANPAASAAMMRKLARARTAFGLFWSEELEPAIRAGYRPPVGEGFRRFIAQPGVEVRVATALERELFAPADPLSAHAALRDRLAQIERRPEAPHTSPPAAALLGDTDAVESAWLAPISAARARPLEPLGWDALALHVKVARWEDDVAAHAWVLAQVDAAAVPGLVADIGSFAMRLGEQAGRSLSESQRRARAQTTLAAGLSVALMAAGWSLHVEPGSSGVLERGDQRIEPFGAVRRLADGTLSPDEWRATCAQAGILEMPLASSSVGSAGWRPKTPHASSS
jgi:hypothetical protein